MENFTVNITGDVNIILPHKKVPRRVKLKSDMRGHLEPDETELLELTDSTLRKLGSITDEQFAELELVPDFGADE